jgi:phospholipid/cholesterol/gamma-HCH transport system permease protein
VDPAAQATSSATVSRDAGGVRIRLRGELNTTLAESIWQEVVDAAAGATGTLTLDLSGVPSCDGVGVGLLVEADLAARERGAEVRVEGASDDLAELLTMARLETAAASPRRPVGAIAQIGDATARTVRTLLDMIGFLGGLLRASVVLARSLSPSRGWEIVRCCARVGADAVPVVSLLGGLVGFILAVQAVKALENVGAVSLVPMVVGFATLREFAPLISGIILAGRSGSAFAAELGTMKVTEELDAYTTMSLDPMVVLIVPRVLAATLVTPLLAIYSMVLGVAGGSIPMFSHDFTFNAYLDGVIESVVAADVLQALVKATVFGFLVGAIGCFQGLATGRGSDAVGLSATRAVVAGIVAILVADSILSTIFYNLGF